MFAVYDNKSVRSSGRAFLYLWQNRLTRPQELPAQTRYPPFPMKKSEIPRMPQFFDRYINLNPDDADVLTALTDTATIAQLIDPAQLTALGDYVYAPGKWTVRDIVQHVIDTERIMAYRALRIARHDETALPGFDENLFAANARATRRPLADLLAEYAVVRQGNLALFGSFNEATLLRSGLCSGQAISVLALGFVLAGHVRHHVRIIRERYLAGTDSPAPTD
jgi:hypothetical protein